jgi:hypothetical protein
MEVGTGRILSCPVGFFLLGAQTIETFDITPYLDPDLNMAMVPWMAHNEDQVRTVFGSGLREERLKDLLACQTFDELLECCSITVHCPADAADTGLPANSIDLHVSQNTFEHIPVPVLEAILQESRRLLSPQGLACHLIDHSDHWAKRSSRHSSTHFLRFSDRTWSVIAGNSHAYQNRLRSSEIRAIFSAAGLREALVQTHVDSRALHAISKDKLNPRYRSLEPEDIATSDTLIVAKAWATRASAIS